MPSTEYLIFYTKFNIKQLAYFHITIPLWRDYIKAFVKSNVEIHEKMFLNEISLPHDLSRYIFEVCVPEVL